MRVVRCLDYGSPSGLVVDNVDPPEPGPGQLLVEIRAAGVNFSDGLIVAGRYQTRPDPPFTPGSEVAGVVSAVGAGVRGFQPGLSVVAYCGMGGYAEQVVVDASRVSLIPDELDFLTAAVLPVAYGTAYHALVDRVALAWEESVLVLGASGGVGRAAVEVAKALGARVLAVASTEEKRELCRSAGADYAFGYDEDEIDAAVHEVSGGLGVDVVVDPVGGASAEFALRKLAWGGRFATIGYASGTVPTVRFNRLLLKEAALVGVLWGAWATRYPQANSANAARLVDLWSESKIRPHFGGTWPLEDAAMALATVMDRRIHGKAVLTVAKC
jgi:NADPH2:quinone reductase